MFSYALTTKSGAVIMYSKSKRAVDYIAKRYKEKEYKVITINEKNGHRKINTP
jgi:superfamily II DNA/RNA helicase